MAGKITLSNDILKKAKDEGGALGKYIHQVIETNQEANVIASDLYSSFKEIKNNFTTGVVNLARYKEQLTKFKEFFAISDITKAEIPVSLGADQILKEIEKHLI